MHKPAFIATVIALLATAPVAADADSDDLLKLTGIQGGLIVHVGCGDGRLTADLSAGERFLVHGLDPSSENVERARDHIRAQGCYGRVSAELWQPPALPYGDSLVNLLLIEKSAAVPDQEITRVLCPGGVACIRKNDGGWTQIAKPWPDDIDQWTHFLYDATNNAVAKDRRVGPPRHVQWTAGPKRTRDHDALASFTTMTSSNGRLFYIVDEGPTSQIHRRPQWRLIARDAFNGVPLWRREIPSWATHLHNFRVGPVHLTRRLISVEDRVYATLGYRAPIAQLDAATGETLRTFDGSENTEEIILDTDAGILLAVLGDPDVYEAEATEIDGYWETRVDREPSCAKSIVAYRAKDGELLWKITGSNMGYLVPLSLTAGDGKAFFLDNECLRCVDLATGQAEWSARYPSEGLFLRNYAPTVALSDGVVVCLSVDKMAAFDAADGRELWRQKQGYYGFASPGDLFVIDGLVWTFPGWATVHYESKDRVLGNTAKEFWALDLRTGEVKHSIAKKDVWPGGHHHRCYRNKATEHYAVCGRRGLEFVDLTGGGDNVINWWVRGICQYGVMPCNGMVYVPPDPCQCFSTIKVDGLLAIHADNSLDQLEPREQGRLSKGPAYGEFDPSAGASEAKPDEWPTYRRDNARSVATTSAVRGRLAKRWQADLGGRLSSVVVAGGRLFVTAVDRHTVHCLDATDGQPIWQFTAGGPVDSPPTIHGNLAIFGSHDGRVYAVTAAEGELVWSFRAGPVDRRIVDHGRLASVWPVHGSVLVLDDVVYFAAGRSSYLDGGIRLYGLKAATGKKLYETVIDSTPADDNRGGALPDVLTSDGTTISMRQRGFDKQLGGGGRGNFAAQTGFLENCWMHRLTWRMQGAAGNLLVFDDRAVYGAMSRYTGWKKNKANWPPTHTGHLHQKYSRYQPEWFPIGNRVFAEKRGGGKQARRKGEKRPAKDPWAHNLPIQIRALVLADDTLLAAGWPDAVTILDQADPEATEDELRKPMLWALAAEDGRKVAQYELDALPVFDGAAVAYGRLFMALKNGAVVCLEGG